MSFRITLFTAACALGLAACGKHEPAEEAATPAPATTAAPAPAATTAMPAPATTAPPAAASTGMPATTSTAAPAATTMGGEKPAATIKDCTTTIEATDAMQYNVGSITVPASCKKFTITLKHTGTMPATSMGHNIVIAKASDAQGVTADGMAAGASADYVKAGDTRVVVHTKVVGGGQTAMLSFDPKKIKDGDYEFFCSFPGHYAMMHGKISVG